MMKCFIPKRLLHHTDSTYWLDRLSEQSNTVFLDSGNSSDKKHGCDILAANPHCLIYGKDGGTVVKTRDGLFSSKESSLDILKQYIPKIKDVSEQVFNGGAIGYFGYDWGLRLTGIQSSTTQCHLPEFMVGIYNWAIVVNHKNAETYLVGYQDDHFSQKDFDAIYAMLQSPAQSVNPRPYKVLGKLSSNMDESEYIRRFNKIKQYIYDGDCYQVNLAQKFSIAFDCDPCDFYKTLRSSNSAPFSTYFDCGDFQILSLSPERFLQLQGSRVQTKPIKGTRPRRADAIADENEKKSLLSSQKDRAENLMIVDLLRNDLGKVCRAGSIVVNKLFDIESFVNVHHMVSTVEGELREDVSALDLLKACFPGGSITGAPKYRAMEIINELEPDSRGVYCGTIGYIDVGGNMDLNIAIRTAVYKDHQLTFYGGGGIVADSDATSEYQETFDKVSPLLQILDGKDFNL